MQPDTIATMLADLLQTVLDAYEDGDGTPPARQFVTHGLQQPWQGEQVSVAWVAFRPVAPFPFTQQSAPRSNVVPSVEFSIEVVRACWPQAQAQAPGNALPSPQALTDGALALATDAATLGSWFQERTVKGGIFPSFPTLDLHGAVRVGEMAPTGPSGNLAGLRLPVQVALAIP